MVPRETTLTTGKARPQVAKHWNEIAHAWNLISCHVLGEEKESFCLTSACPHFYFPVLWWHSFRLQAEIIICLLLTLAIYTITCEVGWTAVWRKGWNKSRVNNIWVFSLLSGKARKRSFWCRFLVRFLPKPLSEIGTNITPTSTEIRKMKKFPLVHCDSAKRTYRKI